MTRRAPDPPFAEAACAALIDHLQCGDPRAALERLVERLAGLLGAPVRLVAIDSWGAERWQRAAGGEAASADIAHALLSGREPIGSLRWPAAAAAPPPALLDAVTALMARDAATPAGAPTPAEDTRLERIAAHVPGLLYQYALKPDLTSRFVFVSPQVKDVIGVDAATATRDATDIFAAVEHEDRPALMASVIASAKELSVWRHEFRVRRPGGEIRWVHGSASPQRETDGTVTWFGYLQDVTSRHEFERVRRDAAVAEAANRAKTDFLSRMSHELRTPLNAVLGFAQLMEIDRDEPASPSQRRRLKLIRDAGDHLLRMIADLLDLTRIESGTLALQVEAVPLRALADEAAALMQALAAQSQVSLAVADAAPGLCVRADRTRLRQVLLNLVSNAIKYNRAGGRVELEIGRAGEPGAASGMGVLRVVDTGLGIAEADLARLFEPFHRGRQSHGAVEGTGIGLGLSRSLVALMKGRLEVQSTVGAGSAFSVLLPAA